MKLIIGLGNPGGKFKNNRHNVGQRFVHEANLKFKISNLKFLESGVFMNDSGKFLAEKVNFFKVSPKDLFIVHDDLDIPLGKFKVDFGVGPKVHNGIASIEEALGTKDFWRVRIGTDAREKGEGKLGDSGKGYVLDDFSKEELKVLDELFPKIREELSAKLS